MTKVIFACVHNAGRSQMAAAWFNRLVTESTPNSQTQLPTPRRQLPTPSQLPTLEGRGRFPRVPLRVSGCIRRSWRS